MVAYIRDSKHHFFSAWCTEELSTNAETIWYFSSRLSFHVINLWLMKVRPSQVQNAREKPKVLPGRQYHPQRLFESQLLGHQQHNPGLREVGIFFDKQKIRNQRTIGIDQLYWQKETSRPMTYPRNISILILNLFIFQLNTYLTKEPILLLLFHLLTALLDGIGQPLSCLRKGME